jgi:hypothetical protein
MSEDLLYTLGRGEVYFDQFLPGTTTISGERYLGNTSEFNLTFAATKLDHFSSDHGIKEKDKSITLEINRSGTLKTDQISPENVALFFFGSTEALAVTQATVTNEPVGLTGAGVEPGMFYQLGMTPQNPSGARKVIYPGASGTLFVLKKGSTTLTYGTDYSLNTDLGRVEILEGGTVLENDLLTCTYTVAASTRTRIISGDVPVEGAVRFIAFNPEGDNIDYYLPSVSLTPNGDYALKGDTWQEISFNIDVLKPGDGRESTKSSVSARAPLPTPARRLRVNRRPTRLRPRARPKTQAPPYRMMSRRRSSRGHRPQGSSEEGIRSTRRREASRDQYRRRRAEVQDLVREGQAEGRWLRYRPLRR